MPESELNRRAAVLIEAARKTNKRTVRGVSRTKQILAKQGVSPGWLSREMYMDLAKSNLAGLGSEFVKPKPRRRRP